MAFAGWCSECNTNVWVGPDGGCANGHPRSSLRGVYEAAPATVPAASHMPSVGAMPQVASSADSSAKEIASAQKLVIYAFILNLVFNLLLRTGSPLMLVPALAVSVFAVVSVYRLALALGYAMALRILFVVLMFVPLASLIVLLMLISRATKALRAAGYEVGLLGARV